MNFYYIGPAILRVKEKDILVGIATFTNIYEDDEGRRHCNDNTESTYMNVVRFGEWIKNTIYGG